MAFSDAGKKLMLDGFSPSAVFVSLHTGDPGTTGANELTGGTPAYIRKAITWNAVSSGNLDSSNTPVFDIPGSTTISHLGYWSAETNGTYYASSDITDEVYAAQGTYDLTDADVTI